MKEIFEIAAAVLAAIGVGGGIVLALSSYLGKIWANRILEGDRAKYAKELQTLRAEFELQLKTYEIRAGAVQADRKSAVQQLHGKLSDAYDNAFVAVAMVRPPFMTVNFERFYERGSDRLHELQRLTDEHRLLLQSSLHLKLTDLADRMSRDLFATAKIVERHEAKGEDVNQEEMRPIQDRYENAYKVATDDIYEEFRVLLGTSETKNSRR